MLYNHFTGFRCLVQIKLVNHRKKLVERYNGYIVTGYGKLVSSLLATF